MIQDMVLKVKHRILYKNLKMLVLSLAIKRIFTNETIAIHFYKDYESNFTDDDLNSCIYKYKCLEFLPEHAIETKSNINIVYLKTFIIDRSIFFLEFLTEENVQDGKHNNIHINVNDLNYDDFSYFYNLVISFPCFVDYMNEYKYRLIFRIIDIFKIQYNKPLKDFIRLILASVVLNTEVIKLWYFSVLKSNKHIVSIALSNIAFVELLGLYGISKAILNQIKAVYKAVITTECNNFGFADLNENFFYLDTCILQKILKIHKQAKYFLKTLNIFFSLHVYKRFFLFIMSYTEEYKCFFNLSLFKNLEELFMFKCLNTKVFIANIIKTMHLQSIKILTVFKSNLISEDEIVWLKELNFEELNYIVTKYDSKTYFSISEFKSPVCIIFSKIIDAIFNNENKSSFYARGTNISCYDQDNEFVFVFYQDENRVKDLMNHGIACQISFRIKLCNMFINVIFDIINFKRLRNIEIEFTYTCIRDFSIYSSEILNNIVTMRIVGSTVNDVFLSKILLFPALKNIVFYVCTIIFLNNNIILSENTNIEYLNIADSLINNVNYFIDLMNKMVGLKSLEIFNMTKNSNPLEKNSDNIKLCLLKLTYLRYSSSYYSYNNALFFPFLPSLLKFNLGSNHPAGTLHKIFFNGNFYMLRKLVFYGIKIGQEDELALQKLTNLHSLTIGKNSEFSNINFSQMFHTAYTYSLTELILPNIEITYFDLKFISELKNLKKLYIYSFILRTNIIFFLKIISSITEIEIEKIFVLKNHIIEECGIRLKISAWHQN
ncbi:hypothetical protein CWI38_0197p0010 [Hamiltosporidium tvaerminnensis]|uniref:Uncharacterized protein n=1 Tax=Hamiltosporidium tvaerminnensis TaxID=1176355 RepID=A0A4Q9M1G3_9MICR|nr:hypothetical protein CWI38_0197p0010 [Hamiltosporidium tvaerminnensis]